MIFFRRGGQLEVPDPPPLVRANGIPDLRLTSAIHRHVFTVFEYATVDGDTSIEWVASELGIQPSTVWRMLQGWKSGRKQKPQLRLGVA